MELKFLNKPALLVLTGRHIKGEDGSSIKIALNDVVTGDVVKSGPEASAKVEIAVLQVDPDGDEGQDWTPVEFKLNIVMERKANLRKNAFVKLKEGTGLIGDKKHNLPSLSDEILGQGMSDKALNRTVEHGLKWIHDDKHFYYHPGSQPITRVVFNDVGQVMERLVESNYVPVADLSENEKATQKLVASAFEHLGDVITYDESSSTSLQIPSVPNVGTRTNLTNPYAGQQTDENGSLCAGADRAVPIDNAQSRKGSKMRPCADIFAEDNG
ncbi:hypothetical protein Acr_19g0007360 [Actinidia rufa]|uniref:Calmodulin binding protein-like protein n=1 Tax=Actinidia rufa TaxID=165716 RepID=A0A7J0GAI1_9ERIC|nr:hypothetical protein Acr_19g0007360 [Actinidia rufa]